MFENIAFYYEISLLKTILTTGYLEFYDERHRPAFPLTGHVICDHLLTIFSEPSTPALWKAGRITGWMEALMEHAPHTFRSSVAEEPMTALQTR